jgi:hypothetical protein
MCIEFRPPRFHFRSRGGCLPKPEPQQRLALRIGSVRLIRGQGTRKPPGQNGMGFTEEYAPAHAKLSKAFLGHIAFLTIASLRSAMVGGLSVVGNP